VRKSLSRYSAVVANCSSCAAAVTTARMLMDRSNLVSSGKLARIARGNHRHHSMAKRMKRMKIALRI